MARRDAVDQLAQRGDFCRGSRLVSFGSRGVSGDIECDDRGEFAAGFVHGCPISPTLFRIERRGRGSAIRFGLFGRPRSESALQPLIESVSMPFTAARRGVNTRASLS
jgi:hypothetical protein